MSSSASIRYDDLEQAIEWVSASGIGNEAFISKATGAIHYVSADGTVDEPVPADVGDDTRYWAVPSKSDLDLGRSLVIRYVQEALPDDLQAVRQYFRRRGAYAQFKALLQRRRHLERWYAYESEATAEALQAWAAENGLQITGLSSRDAESGTAADAAPQRLDPRQFDPDEAWIAFRLNAAPLQTESDGDFHCIALLDGASGRILAMEMVSTKLAGPTAEQARHLLQQARADSQALPAVLYVQAELDAGALEKEAARQRMTVTRVAGNRLAAFIDEPRAAFAARFGERP